MKDPAESRRLIKFFWWIKCSTFWHGNLRVVTKLTSFVDRLLLLMSGIGHPHETPGMCALRIKMLRKGWQGGGGTKVALPLAAPSPPLHHRDRHLAGRAATRQSRPGCPVRRHRDPRAAAAALVRSPPPGNGRGGDQRPKSPQIPWNANQGNCNDPQGGWRLNL